MCDHGQQTVDSSTTNDPTCPTSIMAPTDPGVSRTEVSQSWNSHLFSEQEIDNTAAAVENSAVATVSPSAITTSSIDEVIASTSLENGPPALPIGWYGSGAASYGDYADDDYIPADSDTLAIAHFPSPVNDPISEPDSEQKPVETDVADELAIPGACGLRNLGNTCFMNAGLQCLMSNARLCHFFLQNFQYDEKCQYTLLGKLYELVEKVWSGEYSSLYPREWKDFLGSAHPQFKDYRQHDCQEFLAVLLDDLHEELNVVTDSSDQSGDGETREPSEAGDEETRSISSLCAMEVEAAGMDSTQAPSKIDAADSSDIDMQETSNQKPESARSSPSISCRLEGELKLGGSQSMNSEDVSCNLLAASDSPSASPVARSPSHPIPNNMPPNNTTDTTGTAAAAQHRSLLDTSTVTEVYNIPMEKFRALEAAGQEKNLIATNKSPGLKLPPSIEHFYLKDTKTLNTNVLINNADTDLEEVKFDSSKFLKHDNLATAAADANVLDVSELDAPTSSTNDKFEPKLLHFKKIKDTNLVMNKKQDGKSTNLGKICPDTAGIDNSITVNTAIIENNMNMVATEKNNRCKRIKLDSKTAASCSGVGMPKNGIAANLAKSNLVGATIGGDVVNGLLNLESTTDLEAACIEADREWDRYIGKNKSVIVDTFQGQFKSTVVCSVCRHVSVTYEPFMYLSVPLPHAMERQIAVTFVPRNTRARQLTRYLVTLHKHDSVFKLKEEVKKMAGRVNDEQAEFVACEVLHSRMSRVLEDHTALCYVNESNRQIYVFELNEAPAIPEEAAEECSALPTKETSMIDITSAAQFGVQENDVTSSVEAAGKGLDCEVASNESMDTAAGDLDDDIPGGISSTTAEQSALSSPSSYLSAPDAEDPAGEVSARLPSTAASQGATVGGSFVPCTICLEEFTEDEIKIHVECRCALCHACIQKSILHYGEEFPCPTCSMKVKSDVDFVVMSEGLNMRPKIRAMKIAVCFRLEPIQEANNRKAKLFAHPHMLYVTNIVEGEKLYEMIAQIAPRDGFFTIVVSDVMGMSCARCTFGSACTGCEIPRQGEYHLQPTDNLCVKFSGNGSEEDLACKVVDHVSVASKRPDVPLTLYDCFQAFTECEMLDENNPWLCPVCKCNQAAQKTMAIWRLPEILIVYLKRFVFHEFSSTKVDNQVIFPMNGLDLSKYMAAAIPPNDTVYSLHSCVCHFGGVNAGHYTAYAKHLVQQEWFYFNDENVQKESMKDEDYSNAYILFYQKQDLKMDLLNVLKKQKASATLNFSSESITENQTPADEAST